MDNVMNQPGEQTCHINENSVLSVSHHRMMQILNHNRGHWPQTGKCILRPIPWLCSKKNIGLFNTTSLNVAKTIEFFFSKFQLNWKYANLPNISPNHKKTKCMDPKWSAILGLRWVTFWHPCIFSFSYD